jgi:hypothetical protein
MDEDDQHARRCTADELPAVTAAAAAAESTSQLSSIALGAYNQHGSAHTSLHGQHTARDAIAANTQVSKQPL